jgi:transaldolase/glucose-6-phosphate isomerase
VDFYCYEISPVKSDLEVLHGARFHSRQSRPDEMGRSGGCEHESLLQSVRMTVRDRKRVATCLGFGPRFLHSTGQAYKGGPNSGVFLQITCDDAQDLPVPGQKYTFGVVKAAQARGDFQVLADRQRRALRAHIGSDVKAGLTKLAELVKQIL